MSDDPSDKVRLLHPPKASSRWEPNPRVSDYLLRLAEAAAEGHLGQIVICYRKEDGFGHFVSEPVGSETTLAMMGLLDVVKEIVKSRIVSS